MMNLFDWMRSERPKQFTELSLTIEHGEKLRKVMELMEVNTPADAILGSIKLTRAMFIFNDNGLFLQKGEDSFEFDLLRLDDAVRSAVRTHNSTPDDATDTAAIEIDMPYPRELTSLIQEGEFTSVEECLEFAINVAANYHRLEKQGWQVTFWTGESYQQVQFRLY